MMSNPWYSKVNGQGTAMQPQPQPQTAPMNQMAMMGQIAQAMRNPQAFAMQAFQDVPRELWNRPEKALQHIMQTRGLTQADIQNMIGSLPIPR